MKRVDKPWGHEVWFAHTERYVGKILVIEAGKRLSLQYHREKDESIYVQEGTLRLTLERDGVLEVEDLEARRGASHPAGKPATDSRPWSAALCARSPPRRSRMWSAWRTTSAAIRRPEDSPQRRLPFPISSSDRLTVFPRSFI